MKILHVYQLNMDYLRKCSTGFTAFFCLAMLLTSEQTQAGFYKCVDASGNITYSQMECPADETTDKIISSTGGAISNRNCSIARHFASKTAKQMLRGQGSAEVFDQYGGIDSIPRTSVALINYIYTFQLNQEVTAERITSLAMARCKSGSFGPTDCADFPASYVDNLGGCEWAAKGPNYGRPGLTGEELEEQKNSEVQSGIDVSVDSLSFGKQGGIDSASAVQRSKVECVTKVQSEIETVTSAMRSGGSVSRQDSLRSRMRELRKRLSKC